jgi:hypothetical protein
VAPCSAVVLLELVLVRALPRELSLRYLRAPLEGIDFSVITGTRSLPFSGEAAAVAILCLVLLRARDDKVGFEGAVTATASEPLAADAERDLSATVSLTFVISLLCSGSGVGRLMKDRVFALKIRFVGAPQVLFHLIHGSQDDFPPSYQQLFSPLRLH